MGGASECSASSDVGVPFDVREPGYVERAVADASEPAMKMSLLSGSSQK